MLQIRVYVPHDRLEHVEEALTVVVRAAMRRRRDQLPVPLR